MKVFATLRRLIGMGDCPNEQGGDNWFVLSSAQTHYVVARIVGDYHASFCVSNWNSSKRTSNLRIVHTPVTDGTRCALEVHLGSDGLTIDEAIRSLDAALKVLCGAKETGIIMIEPPMTKTTKIKF